MTASAAQTGLSLAVWRKSTRSAPDKEDCVEVTTGLPGLVAVRDSKRRAGPALTTTSRRWAAFLHAVKTDAFSLR